MNWPQARLLNFGRLDSFCVELQRQVGLASVPVDWEEELFVVDVDQREPSGWRVGSGGCTG